MLRTIDQPPFVLEGEPEDFCRLQVRPDGIIETIFGRAEDLIALVLRIGEQPHPFVFAG